MKKIIEEKEREEEKDQVEQLKEENRSLYKKIYKMENFISQVKFVIERNPYNNDKVVLNKIREIIRDYQSKQI